MNTVQYGALVRTPEGSDQQVSGTVARDPVYHNLRRQLLDAVNQQLRVFLLSENRELRLFIIICQIGILQNVKQLQLDPLNRKLIQVLDGIQHHRPVFTGKPQNRMDDDLGADGM